MSAPTPEAAPHGDPHAAPHGDHGHDTTAPDQTPKWVAIRMNHTGCQGPSLRSLYQVISSGRLAIQISMYCEKPM